MSDHAAFIHSGEMLRRLAPPIRPGAPAAPAAPLELFESRAFDELLAQAVNGTLRSGRTVACECDLQPPLDAAQLERLADAADSAEAQGVRRALMMIDGRGLEIDIATRAVISELTPTSGARPLRIDAALIVPRVSQPSGDARIGNAGRTGSPFAGINDLTAARLSFAAKSGDALSAFAPKSR